MYVYVCADTPDATKKSTCVKVYRESSLSSESIECSYLKPTVNNEKMVEHSFFLFKFIENLHSSLFLFYLIESLFFFL